MTLINIGEHDIHGAKLPLTQLTSLLMQRCISRPASNYQSTEN